MQRSQILIWTLGIFTASILSIVVGFMGYVFNQSTLPPMGGGVFKLIVLPISFLWIVILGAVFFRQKAKAREAASEAMKKNLQKANAQDHETRI